MKRISMVLVLGLGLLAGCISIGHDFDSNKVAQIQIGVTTQAEVRQMFGDPWRTGVDSGDVTWTYASYSASITGKAQAKDLVIRFDAHGVVKSYSYNATATPKQ